MTDYVLSAELTLKDKFTAKIKEATKASEKFKEAFKKIDDSLKHFGETHKLDGFVNKINTVSSKINKLAINALKVGAVGSAGLLIGASKVGADFEALSARMQTAFQGDKKKAAEYYKWANEFANQTPFENEEVIDAVVRLKSYGYDPKRMMTMLGDFAGAYGKTLEQSVEAYADASRGEFERLKEFGITKEQVLEYAKKTMGKNIQLEGSKKDLDGFMKALDGLIQKRSKDGMKNLAKTLGGMLSTTRGLLKYNIAKLVGLTDEGHIRAGSLIDRIKQKFEKFNSYMESEEGKKAIDKWIDAFDNALPQIIKLAGTIKDKFKEIAGENFMEKLNESIKNFDPKSFNKGLDEIQKKFETIADIAMRVGGVLLGAKLLAVNPYLGAVAMTTGLLSPELLDGINLLKEEEKDPNSERAEELRKTPGGGFFLKQRQHRLDMMNFQMENDMANMEFIRSFTDKQKAHNQNIINNISINIDGAITNKDDKVAYLDIANQLREEIQKTIDKSFDNITTEIEFA